MPRSTIIGWHFSTVTLTLSSPPSRQIFCSWASVFFFLSAATLFWSSSLSHVSLCCLKGVDRHTEPQCNLSKPRRKNKSFSFSSTVVNLGFQKQTAKKRRQAKSACNDRNGGGRRSEHERNGWDQITSREPATDRGFVVSAAAEDIHWRVQKKEINEHTCPQTLGNKILLPVANWPVRWGWALVLEEVLS